MNAEPKNFKLVTTFAIVLGVLGLLSALSTGASVIIGSDKISRAAATEQATPELQALQDAMMAETNAITERWRIPNGLIAIAKLFLSAGLIAGGLFAQRVTRRGRTLLQRVFLGGLFFEPIAAIPAFAITIATVSVTQRFMEEMMKASAGPDTPAGVGDFVGGIVSASMYTGLVAAASWLALKILYFVWGRRRLAAPDVEAFFREHGR